MTANIQFFVEGQNFELAPNCLRMTDFMVRSIPHDYRVTIKHTGFDSFLEEEMVESPKTLFLIDENVWKLYWGRTRQCPANVYLFEALEENKDISAVLDFIQFLQKNGMNKGGSLFVVGGGITQDVGAFAGACYKRGIPWTYVPTTLLSMCDSCIGGKTGINNQGAKNQLALFSAPLQVHAFLDSLITLPKQHMLAGLGEILKLHAIGGELLLDSYQKIVIDGKIPEPEHIHSLILGALHVKKAIIEVDEFEKNTRKVLNYGHTFGHALESALNYSIPHGQAVALGMIIANQISCQHGVANSTYVDKINSLCFDLLRDIKIPVIEDHRLMELLTQDKKVFGKQLSLVVPGSMPGNWNFLKLPLEESLVTGVSDFLRDLVS